MGEAIQYNISIIVYLGTFHTVMPEWINIVISIIGLLGILLSPLFSVNNIKYKKKKKKKSRKPYKLAATDKEPYLTTGNLNFKYLSTMKMHTKYRVAVNIFKTKWFMLEDKAMGESHNILVSDIMKCVLKGDAFIIESLNTDTQGLLEQLKTGWQWDVQPIKRGRQSLHLIVSLQLKINSQVVLKDIPIFERYVMVQAHIPKQVKTFVQKNWQWLVGTVIGSGILWQALKTFVFKDK
jgi:hypothetical protein